MPTRALLTACLVFSGLSALVYQVLWTRLLGFAFGTTTEAIGTVIAVFFAGLAIGNLIAARRIDRVVRPLRLYGMLELGIGLFALASLPLLRNLDGIYAIVGVDHSRMTILVLRTLVAAAVLLPPTIAMGATLPIVARGLVASDSSLGRWSAYLYSANTLGAVIGAYLCGFWMIPTLGLTWTVIVAAAVNLAVALVVWIFAGGLRVDPSLQTQTAEPITPHAASDGEAHRGIFLVFFGISGFVAIGYEIVWSKIFTIVMEGTLYGFSTVLSAYLLGLALGSALISRYVDRIRDLPRAFGLLHAGIALSVAIGLALVADLPYWHHRVADLVSGGGGIHGLYLLAAPIVLLPTMLFGAAFPILIRLYTSRASRVGEGMGIATAVNTGGSIVASLLISFVVIPAAGIDATLYALVMLELTVAVIVLLRFQRTVGRQRVWATAAAGMVIVTFSLSYGGVHVEKAVAGRWIDAANLDLYHDQLASHVERNELVVEGRAAVVTVNSHPGGWKLMTNGMPEAGYNFAPPHRSLATLVLGILPYMTVEEPKRALVVGFGGGATLDALRQTQVESIEVVELEASVLEAARFLYQGRDNPLADPRVELTINDGRNHLLLDRHRGGGRYDIIASQPSHPWLAGAANLFTEEYFRLAWDNLADGGAFGLWVNGFHAEPKSLLALFTSFQRIFPDAVIVTAGGKDHRSSFVLVGGKGSHDWRLGLMRAHMAEPKIAEAFALHDVEDIYALFARFEGPLAGFAEITPDASNTDDNAYVEMHLSRSLEWGNLDFEQIDEQLAADAPVLPPFEESVDIERVARAMFEAQKQTQGGSYGPKLRRLIAAGAASLDPYIADLLRAEIDLRDPAVTADVRSAAVAALETLIAAEPTRPEAMRSLARYRAEREKDFAGAGQLFGKAWTRAHEPVDAYDAARAWHWTDRAQAWTWAQRVPAGRSAEFPRLPYFEAHHALAAEAAGEVTLDRAERQRLYDQVRGYLDTTEGRRLPDVHDLLARLAVGLGDETLIRAHADLATRQRQGTAQIHVGAARQALEQGNLTRAREEALAAQKLMPSDFGVLRVVARVADASNDDAMLSDALWEIRRWSVSMREGVGNENIARFDLQLPLLPQRPPSALGREDSRVERPR